MFRRLRTFAVLRSTMRLGNDTLRLQSGCGSNWKATDEVKRTIKAMRKILKCSESACHTVLSAYPELQRRSPEHISSVALMLKAHYDPASILKYGYILAKDWQTIQQRKLVLEELGLQQLGLNHLAVFPFILKRTIFDLKTIDKLIPEHYDVIKGIIKLIPNCSRSFMEKIFNSLPASVVSTMPLMLIWKTIMNEYVRHRLECEEFPFGDNRRIPVYEQSLRIMVLRLDLLIDRLGFTSDLILRNHYLLTADAFNIQTMLERVTKLSQFHLKTLAERDPRILLAKTEDMCEIELVLRSQDVSPEQVWSYPRIYLSDPAYLRARFEEVKESPSLSILRGSRQFLQHLTKTGPRTNVYLMNSSTGGKSPFLNYLCWRFKVTKTEKKELYRKLKLYHGSMPRSVSDMKISTDYLVNEIGFNREQLLNNPTLMLISQKALVEGWRVLSQSEHIKEFGSVEEWRKSNIASEMLLYEIESDHDLQSVQAVSLVAEDDPVDNIYLSSEDYFHESDSDDVDKDLESFEATGSSSEARRRLVNKQSPPSATHVEDSTDPTASSPHKFDLDSNKTMFSRMGSNLSWSFDPPSPLLHQPLSVDIS